MFVGKLIEQFETTSIVMYPIALLWTFPIPDPALLLPRVRAAWMSAVNEGGIGPGRSAQPASEVKFGLVALERLPGTLYHPFLRAALLVQPHLAVDAVHSFVIPLPAQVSQPIEALPESPAQLHRDDFIQR